MGSVTVCSARSGDVPRMVELLQHGALVDGGEDPSEVDAYVSAPAEIQALPGCDVLVAEVESMHVHPGHRGRGVGTRLLAAAVEAARLAGCYRVQLTSNRERTDAHRFYARHGFRPSHVGFKLLLVPG